MNNGKHLKILMTGPENDPSISLGGIVTVVNMILNNSHQKITYFNRDMGESSKAVTLIKKLRKFNKLLSKERFDLVHFHFSFDRKSLLREALYLYIAKRKKQPFIIHFHGGILLFQKKESRLINWMLATANNIIVLSEIEKESLARLYHVPADKILVLRNCIDLKEIPASTQQPQKQNKLIFFGRLHESKGIEDIVEACKLLKEQSIDFHFYAYGSGPQQQWFVSTMQNLLSGRFDYRGLVWGEKKWQALQDSDVFLLPSRYGEGLPMALLEAMALGKVVIASDDASISKVVNDNVNGLLVEKKAPAILAQKIKSILSDSEQRRKLGSHARTTIEQEYSSDYYMDSLTSAYNNVLNN